MMRRRERGVRRLARLVAVVDDALERSLPPASEPPVTLHRAMRYATLGSGKRFRGCLALAAAESTGGDCSVALPAAVAVELVHAYSLVHDDLPAMDDAAVRRGQPSLHVAFGEATALLAGDALLTLAFEVLATAGPPEVAARCVAELARAAGSRGMVGGQQYDTASAAQARPSWEEISRLKTGCLFVAAARCGGLLAGADAHELGLLSACAGALGTAYQLLDDLRDRGEDAIAGRQDPLGALGEEGARQKAASLLAAARRDAGGLGPRAGLLLELVDRVADGGRSPA